MNKKEETKEYLDLFSFKNKMVFVAGGLGLIGKEVVKAFSQAGAKVIIIDIDSSEGEVLSKEIDNASFSFLNCSDLEKLEHNLNKILDNYTCPDVFVNCSWPRTEDFAENNFQDFNLSSFRENVDIHMNSYAFIATFIAECMKRNSVRGSIIQFGSTYGLVGQDLSVYEGTSMKENAAYATIKGGIINLSRSMASYYGQFNIRINTICPGGVEGHVAGSSEKQSKVFLHNYSKRVPLKRLALSKEIAAPTLFLASEASSYITGTTLLVDGGWTAV